MGGYGAFYNGMRYHDTFGAIVALSAALVVDETLPVQVPTPRFPTEHGVFHTFEVGPGAHEWDTHMKKALDWLPLESGSEGRSSGNVGLD